MITAVARAVTLEPEGAAAGAGPPKMADVQRLRLVCSLPWPLPAVLDPGCLQQLNAVHAFLLQARC